MASNTGNPGETRPIIVQKYGGSSVADAEKISTIARKICDRAETGVSMVVVVSAMGDSTDELIDLANAVSGDHPPAARELDTLLSTGELVTSTLMAMAITATGHPAVSLSGQQAGIRTDKTHGSARIADIRADRLRRELDQGRICVVAGFQGLSDNDDVTTLGRGGSDTTAVALGVALKADQCEIYTDVDGIYTTDPRLVPTARKLAEIGYDEMLEMASLGAKMNPRSIELGAVYDVPILVASTFEDVPGTLIHGGDYMMEVRRAVTGVAIDRDVSKITVRAVEDRPGVVGQIFVPLAEAGVSVDVIVQNASLEGLTDVTFTVSGGDFERALALTKEICSEMAQDVAGNRGLAKMSIVGTGMQNGPGYAATMFAALSKAGVNIEMITTSEIRITCVIDAEHIGEAANALHNAFELDQAGD
ncbi:MAG: aspartate kinase [Chloroflexi bacterium]|nr:aspartate kinase [Chloroflexota bacterium]MBT4515180.1 aspartate kinase [Chloroflexota bacterium]